MNIENNKKKLEEEKKLIESELSGLGQIDKTTGEWEAVPEVQTSPEADENDLSDRSEDFEERTGVMTALEARLEDINYALNAIENGGYGICKVCGNKIEEDRLEANPAAHTCKACMEKVV